jgi:hypothetical protein
MGNRSRQFFDIYTRHDSTLIFLTGDHSAGLEAYDVLQYLRRFDSPSG